VLATADGFGRCPGKSGSGNTGSLTPFEAICRGRRESPLPRTSSASGRFSQPARSGTDRPASGVAPQQTTRESRDSGMRAQGAISAQARGAVAMSAPVAGDLVEEQDVPPWASSKLALRLAIGEVKAPILWRTAPTERPSRMVAAVRVTKARCRGCRGGDWAATTIPSPWSRLTLDADAQGRTGAIRSYQPVELPHRRRTPPQHRARNRRVDVSPAWRRRP